MGCGSIGIHDGAGDGFDQQHDRIVTLEHAAEARLGLTQRSLYLFATGNVL